MSLFLHATTIGLSAQETYLTVTGEEVGSLDIFQDCTVCPEMIVLPLGTFQMGSSVEEANAAGIRYLANTNIDTSRQEEKLRRNLGNSFLNETPAHQVEIDRPIAMGRNEVTREDWAACVEGGGCERGQVNLLPAEYISCENALDCVPTPDARIGFRLQRNPHPVHPRGPRVGITYYEAVDYTSWLNEKIGTDVYRLPTEAEWEYAARAGTNTWFAQGDVLTLDQANFMVSWRKTINGKYVWDYDLGSAGVPLPVDQLDAANGWGLRHMSGNVGERTSTCGDGPHRGFSTSSGYLEADRNRPDCDRSVKGGLYAGNVELSRPARRVAISSDHWSVWTGFRVVRDLDPIFDTVD